MKELIEYIAQSLTSNPDAVRVTEEDEGDQIVIRLEVAPRGQGQGHRAAGTRGSGDARPVARGRRERRLPRRAGDCLGAIAAGVPHGRQRRRALDGHPTLARSRRTGM